MILGAPLWAGVRRQLPPFASPVTDDHGHETARQELSRDRRVCLGGSVVVLAC